MEDESTPAHLEPSQLGTKEYWDNLYTKEITNHASNPSDTGTVWFDDSDAESKIIRYLGDIEPPLSSETTSFLDLGCGNGSLLFSLREEGWQGDLLGVDYSAKSVSLARQIAEASEETASDGRLSFREWDVLAGDYGLVLQGGQSEGWDVVLDKGTFDAISLSDEKDSSGRRLCEGYKERVLQLVKRNSGLFILTSCNWTEEELRKWFRKESGEDGFEVEGRVEYRTFSFGGAKGQTISTLCFRRT